MNDIRKTWKRLKAEHSDSVILIRLGDFYEAFNEDAETVSETCGVVFCSRPFGDARWPMAGFPVFAAEAYIRDLVEAGCRVVVADRVQGHIDKILELMEGNDGA